MVSFTAASAIFVSRFPNPSASSSIFSEEASESSSFDDQQDEDDEDDEDEDEDDETVLE